MRRVLLLGTLLLGNLPSGAQEEWRVLAEAPIVVPKDAVRPEIPDAIQKAAREFGLNLRKVPVFHEKRNILELSYYGKRRGVELTPKVSVIVENGLKRFWLANQFPHPDPTTVVGPFTGNAIKKLDLPKILREGLAERNFGGHMQAISGLLSSDDAELVKLGLQALPFAMEQDVREVDDFLHFAERSLPRRIEVFETMGLTKQTERALASMEMARKRIKAVTVEAERPDYQAGYDPRVERRNGIGVLPEAAWGEDADGLQAALTAPEKLELNQRIKLWFVFRNVSDKTLRVSLPEITGNLRFGYAATPHLWSGGTEGVRGGRQAPTHWTLEPGHQAMVLCQTLQVMERNASLVPKGTLENGQPGVFRVWASSSWRDKWKTLPNGERKLVAVPEGDWKGYIKTGTREVTLLETVAPFKMDAPRELGRNHGLEIVKGNPQDLDQRKALAIGLRPGTLLFLQRNNSHWLLDYDTYTTPTAWGPMSSARVKQLGLLDLVEADSRKLIATPAENRAACKRLAELVHNARPLASLGLKLVPEMKFEDDNRDEAELIARSIRNRRPELVRLGLEKELRTALQLLTAHYPPLPPAAEFTVIENRELPPDLPAEAWGPENDGLRAAALMPMVIKDGSAPDIPLLIRNVSDHDIHLTVANRPGYDYATITDPNGVELPSQRPHVYPMAFSGFRAPEIDPGCFQQSPPLTTFTKLLLKPGAVYKLKTGTQLGYATEDRQNPLPPAVAIAIGPGQDLQEPARTTITHKPVEALITWHLHTANGTIWDAKSEKRTWPAKGGWSGILETAPIKVRLAE